MNVQLFLLTFFAAPCGIYDDGTGASYWVRSVPKIDKNV
jgi:hypothetical protein